ARFSGVSAERPRHAGHTKLTHYPGPGSQRPSRQDDGQKTDRATTAATAAGTCSPAGAAKKNPPTIPAEVRKIQKSMGNAKFSPGTVERNNPIAATMASGKKIARSSA